MEHYQVAEVALIAPDAWDRTFTLREIARRGQRVGRRAPNEDVPDWFRQLSAGRTRTELVGAWHLDVADPAGQGSLAIERTADEVDGSSTASWTWPGQSGGPRPEPETRQSTICGRSRTICGFRGE
jgi:hypothetical protein